MKGDEFMNNYLISLFYWCEKTKANASTSLTLNNNILGLKKQIKKWIRQCEKLQRNPLSILVRYVSGNRTGGHARELLNCTINEFFQMYQDKQNVSCK